MSAPDHAPVAPVRVRLQLGPSGPAALTFLATGWAASFVLGDVLALFSATLAGLFLAAGASTRWRLARLRLRAPRHVRARAGVTVGVDLELSNAHARAPLRELFIRGGEPARGPRAPRAALGLFRAREARSVRVPIRFEARGPRNELGVEVTSDFPLGLVRATATFSLATEVLVGPRPARVTHLARRLLEARARASAPLAAPRGDEEPAELRPWRPGEGERRIHWRASARRGRRLVRTFEGSPEPPVELRFRTAGYAHDAADRECFEHAASLVDALLEELVRRGHPTWFALDEEPAHALRGGVGCLAARDLLTLALPGGHAAPGRRRAGRSSGVRADRAFRRPRGRAHLTIGLGGGSDPARGRVDARELIARRSPQGGLELRLPVARRRRSGRRARRAGRADGGGRTGAGVRARS